MLIFFIIDEQSFHLLKYKQFLLWKSILLNALSHNSCFHCNFIDKKYFRQTCGCYTFNPVLPRYQSADSHLRAALRCTQSFRRSGLGPEIPRFHKLPRNTSAAGPGNRLWVAGSTLVMILNLNTIIMLLYVIIVRYIMLWCTEQQTKQDLLLEQTKRWVFDPNSMFTKWPSLVLKHSSFPLVYSAHWPLNRNLNFPLVLYFKICIWDCTQGCWKLGKTHTRHEIYETPRNVNGWELWCDRQCCIQGSQKLNKVPEGQKINTFPPLWGVSS